MKMEFNEKLQNLRKQKGLTQEELAMALYVSRTAISKWESGRGYPNIDSLKAIARYFNITIDELLSGDEVLTIAEEESKQKAKHFCDLIFGLLDVSVGMFLFLPLFGQKSGEFIESVSLLSLTAVQSYLRIGYFALVIGVVFWGILILALQNCRKPVWESTKSKVSLILNVIAVLLFTLSLQPYPAVFAFVFLVIKVLVMIKRR